jgi:hypothetical protein
MLVIVHQFTSYYEPQSHSLDLYTPENLKLLCILKFISYFLNHSDILPFNLYISYKAVLSEI